MYQHSKLWNRLKKAGIALVVIAVIAVIGSAAAGAAPNTPNNHRDLNTFTRVESVGVPISVTNGNIVCPWTDARSCGLDPVASNLATFNFTPTSLSSITEVVVNVHFRHDCVGAGEQFAIITGEVGTPSRDGCTVVFDMSTNQGEQQSDLDIFGINATGQVGAGSFQGWMEPGSGNVVSASAVVTGTNAVTSRGHCGRD